MAEVAIRSPQMHLVCQMPRLARRLPSGLAGLSALCMADLAPIGLDIQYLRWTLLRRPSLAQKTASAQKTPSRIEKACLPLQKFAINL